jgi:hypothetical protein
MKVPHQIQVGQLTQFLSERHNDIFSTPSSAERVVDSIVEFFDTRNDRQAVSTRSTLALLCLFTGGYVGLKYYFQERTEKNRALLGVSVVAAAAALALIGRRR